MRDRQASRRWVRSVVGVEGGVAAMESSSVVRRAVSWLKAWKKVSFGSCVDGMLGLVLGVVAWSVGLEEPGDAMVGSLGR